MNFSNFFIDRPIFAAVLSVMIFIAGAIAMFTLPVSEYPEVSPPSVQVSASFPGASPSVISETVAMPLEEQINGVENMLYMSSLATTDGVMQLTVTFQIGTDADLAQQMVQNRVSQAEARLPEIVRQLGVTTVKSSPDLSMIIHLVSPDNSYDALYLGNYATMNIRDRIARLPGIGQVAIFGQGDYAMRIWLNPEKIAERELGANAVINAIRGQNIQVSAGVIGGPPYDEYAQFQMPINATGRLSTPEEFGEIIIKRDAAGTITRLSDVARIEVDAQQYSVRSLLDGKEAGAIAVFATPDANALELSTRVRAEMESIRETLPEGIDYDIVYDPTVFVKDSIKAVIKTLLEAVFLVVIVITVFLQTWRASIIPLLAVPVAIVGTFAFLLALGFSINVLSLFGLILAVGIVVDDAIVVVENVERNVENGLAPREAAIRAMGEVTGPIVATSLVLSAVFIPIAFISGLTGQFYQQFALTIAIATIISTFNSLTLSPALCALLLQPKGAPKDGLTRFMDKIFGWFFVRFNKRFRRGSIRYEYSVGHMVRHKAVMLTVYALLIVCAGFFFKSLPSGFVPAQDKSYLIGFAQLPQGATLSRTEEVVDEMTSIMLAEPGVRNAIGLPGLSINGFTSSSNNAVVFVALDEFEKRTSDELSGFAIAEKLQQKLLTIDGAYVAVFPPPAVMGLGTLGGFRLQVQDRADLGFEALDAAMKNVTAQAYQHPALSGIFTSYNIDSPQLFADIDRTKAQQMGLNISDVFQTMQIYLGSMYVNDFNLFGRTYQVIAQADKQYRSSPDDILQLRVPNDSGEMVPLGSVLRIEETFGPATSARYNAFRAADLNGDAAPGYSSGEAQAAITEILRDTLPQGMDFEWTELTYQQILAGNTTMYIFPLCILLVFLVLAAQYESLSLPLAIILIVPMSILAAAAGVLLFGGDNNIFTQISLFVLAGLACKNAILMVEFARELERQGRSIIQAAREASFLRLRPILMTSFAFIMGVAPLVFSEGAGAEMRNAIGYAVFSGMIGVTFFGLIFTPVFYVLIRQAEVALKNRNNKHRDDTPDDNGRTARPYTTPPLSSE